LKFPDAAIKAAEEKAVDDGLVEAVHPKDVLLVEGKSLPCF